MQLLSTCLGVVTRLRTGTVLWDSRSRQIPEVQIRAQIPVESYTSISDRRVQTRLNI